MSDRLLLAIAQKHGAYNVRVFGSVGRGEATQESDIDLLVDYDLEKITPWFPGGLLLDLEQLLNRKVDIAERGYVERTHSRARFAGSCTTLSARSRTATRDIRCNSRN